MVEWRNENRNERNKING